MLVAGARAGVRAELLGTAVRTAPTVAVTVEPTWLTSPPTTVPTGGWPVLPGSGAERRAASTPDPGPSPAGPDNPPEVPSNDPAGFDPAWLSDVLAVDELVLEVLEV